MGDRPRYAIIPTNGRACLKDAVMALQPQVDRLILVYTVPYVDGEISTGMTMRALGDTNISWWWNCGLNLAQEDLANWGESAEFNGFEPPRTDEWDVAILNDDAIVPEGWFDHVSASMRAYGAAAACSGAPYTQLLIEPGPIAGISNPLTGFAFMLAGEKGLRANEDLHWYFSDNYIDWESRKLGGTLMVSGFPVQHLHANAQMGHDLIARVAVDAQNFVDLYGMRPW